MDESGPKPVSSRDLPTPHPGLERTHSLVLIRDSCPLNFVTSSNFCGEQLAQMLVELTNRVGISTKKRKMAIDGLDRPELGIGMSLHSAWQSDGGKNISEDIGMTKARSSTAAGR